MPRSKEPHGFQPIEVEIGEQNRPIVSEVDFSTPARKPVHQAQPAPDPKPQPAADQKEN